MNKDTLLHLFIGLLTIFISTRISESVRWLALMSSTTTIQNEKSCDSLSGLVKRQKKLCKRNVELMESVKVGAQRAIDECQYQFKHRRWNCSTTDSKRLFGNVILKQGTREAAFVHAISSAGVAHAVTRACSSGQLQKCGCDRTVRGRSPEGFEWSGCSHNIAYGTAFSKAFVDAREKGKKRKKKNPGRALMNLHNNEAGRNAVEKFMKIECKCHGVSGSCETKTCWKAMPTFREVGRILKEKFDGATEVRHTVLGTRSDLVPLNDQFKPHTEADLVYLAASPDFCEPDKKTGSLGTHGRKCNKTSKALDGCELMCCGRGYTTMKKTVIERCMCKFHWCCYVKCKKCERDVDEHICN